MPLRMLLLLFSLFLIAVAHAERAPNVVLVITDDQGFGDVSIHGNEALATPNLDRIAQEGARFERFFVDPVCAPTRAALLTGRYPTRTGVTGVTRGLENMRGEEITIAEMLKDAGYATGAFGKWHNGAHWPYHPNGQGFDEFIGFCGGHWNDYYDPMLERNGEYFQARGFIADIITDHAMEFMTEKQSDPFFCYVPYNTPHTPSSVPHDLWQRWSKRTDVENPFTRAMYALVENIDHNVGRLLAHLDKLELSRDTIVIFMTDNGPNGDRFNADMLGRKGSEMEGGVRVPFFVRWPGRIQPGSVVEENYAHIDLLPTLSRLTGAELPTTNPLDGIDMSPALLGNPEKVDTDRLLFTWRHSRKWSVRSPRYRATAKTLHDLTKDPSQQKNLAEQKPEKHKELLSAFWDWSATAVPKSPAPLPVQIGHPEWPRITIKAHEFQIYPGEKEGIDYTSRGGSANHWITRWSSEEAYAECPVEVLEDSQWKLTLRYACEPGSVGSSFLLQGGEMEQKITISEPWVSAVTPMAEQGGDHGRIYVNREWKDLEVGPIELKAGSYPLQLHVLRKQRGGLFMPDVKAIILERIP